MYIPCILRTFKLQFFSFKIFEESSEVSVDDGGINVERRSDPLKDDELIRNDEDHFTSNNVSSKTRLTNAVKRRLDISSVSEMSESGNCYK